jgi:phosphoribosylanthranilate isomerase
MTTSKEIKIKVCGMRDSDNIREVAALSPDYLGFIFYPKSPRFVGDEFKSPASLPSSITRVGVFVNESTQFILMKSKSAGFTVVQLHGNESPDQAAALKDAGLQIIKVFSVGDDFNFAVTKPYESSSDYFLFDTKGKLFGGNAKTFNWSILNQYDQQVPFFLSGGLSAENLQGIKDLQHMNLHALDLNSGVELMPGLKDPARIQQTQELANNFWRKPTI